MTSLYRNTNGLEIVVDVMTQGANIIIRKHGTEHREYVSFAQLRTFRDVLSEAVRKTRGKR